MVQLSKTFSFFNIFKFVTPCVEIHFHNKRGKNRLLLLTSITNVFKYVQNLRSFRYQILKLRLRIKISLPNIKGFHMFSFSLSIKRKHTYISVQITSFSFNMSVNCSFYRFQFPKYNVLKKNLQKVVKHTSSGEIDRQFQLDVSWIQSCPTVEVYIF